MTEEEEEELGILVVGCISFGRETLIEKITMKGRTDVSIMVAAPISSCVGADGREHNLHSSQAWQHASLVISGFIC